MLKMKNVLIICAMEKEAKSIANKLNLIKTDENIYKNENIRYWKRIISIMEKEVRYYYSLTEEDRIIKFLREIKQLKYIDRFYEKTIQYVHPIEAESFYKKIVDGRFRVRISKGEKQTKAMITWKRRLKEVSLDEVNTEEEIEVRINPKDYDNQIYIIENILKMKKVESYERYRTIFKNEEIEIAVDRYPFGIALEIENKMDDCKGDTIIKKWLNILKLDIKDSYKLSWDDKYSELCRKQNLKQSKNVNFNVKMPSETKKFKR